ncbi:MAG: DUF3488 and transglutaminase-like domain-containing protein, partial [Actinomycetota bacterium]|nr:DUF3488 and transglutaminase-like domain-containing protein [Actinomycetota bacterium]
MADDRLARLSLHAAGLATGAAFSVLFAGGALWTMLGAALAAVLLGSAGGYRLLLLPPGAVLYATLAAYGPPPASREGWREVVREMGADAYAAAGTMYAQPAPYESEPGLVLVLTPVAMAVVGLSVFLALRWRSPVPSVALMGSTIGVLSTVSLEEGAGPFFAAFLAASVLLLLASGGLGKTGPAPLGVGAFVVGVVLLLPQSPLAGTAIRPALVDWQEIGTAVGGAAGEPRLAVRADVGEYLNGAREVELFRARSPEPLLWRGGSLDRFDGAGWESTAHPGAHDGEETAPGVETRQVEQRVRVTGATTDLVFGGYEISRVFGVSAERRSDGSWVSDAPLTEGSEYGVVSEVPQPTTAQLRAAGTAYPAAVRERFLQLPEDVPAEVGETAEKVRVGYDTATPYDTARAIERYLLYDGGFVYDLDADYTRADRAIGEFLGDGKRGFCVQFATSMALVAREMGVPSRVVYGARPGEKVAPGEYVVRGRDMHTWVEVFFPGVGWYPFDPTPGFGVSPVMQENAPAAAPPITAAPAEPAVAGQVAPGGPAPRTSGGT